MVSVKMVLSLVFIMVSLGACAQKPVVSGDPEWVLTPETPDQRLIMDDQFLKKSQESAQQTAESKSYRRTFLKP